VTDFMAVRRRQGSMLLLQVRAAGFGPERRLLPASTSSRLGAKQTRQLRTGAAVPDPKRHFATDNYCTAKGLFDHLVGDGTQRVW
jgi:hypothetical protein